MKSLTLGSTLLQVEKPLLSLLLVAFAPKEGPKTGFVLSH